MVEGARRAGVEIERDRDVVEVVLDVAEQRHDERALCRVREREPGHAAPEVRRGIPLVLCEGLATYEHDSSRRERGIAVRFEVAGAAYRELGAARGEGDPRAVVEPCQLANGHDLVRLGVDHDEGRGRIGVVQSGIHGRDVGPVAGDDAPRRMDRVPRARELDGRRYRDPLPDGRRDRGGPRIEDDHVPVIAVPRPPVIASHIRLLR